ncbi:hypothetical protein [Kyrpidia sp.]|uniref:hypothetical protein n=1 Tax=Kyrpidia sp. TaxID=2073077 RepID=UPI002587F858|nr:hypothetical protein [Kyrpidia sp.]MCL6574623.1 hypothetical protein [Kyrpidia sp.]
MRYCIIPLAIAALIVAAGCGASQGQPAGTASESPEKQTEAPSKVSVADGKTRMEKYLQDFRDALTAQDRNRVSQSAKEIEEAWESFENTVKSQTPDLYSKIEDPLGIVQAGSKEEPLDVKTLSDAATKLENVLKELPASP